MTNLDQKALDAAEAAYNQSVDDHDDRSYCNDYHLAMAIHAYLDAVGENDLKDWIERWCQRVADGRTTVREAAGVIYHHPGIKPLPPAPQKDE